MGLCRTHAENWGLVLAQDFANMQFVHKGMKSRGFRGPLPNPHQEQKVINLHRNLANFMGRGGVEEIAMSYDDPKPAQPMSLLPGQAAPKNTATSELKVKAGGTPVYQAHPRSVRGRGDQDPVRHPRSQLRPPVP